MNVYSSQLSRIFEIQLFDVDDVICSKVSCWWGCYMVTYLVVSLLFLEFPILVVVLQSYRIY